MKFNIRISVKAVAGTFETDTSRVFDVTSDNDNAAKASCPDEILDMTVRDLICGKQTKKQLSAKKVFSDNIKVYVAVGDTDESAEYVALDEHGYGVPDYPLPKTKISLIDRDARLATDELLRSYPLICMPSIRDNPIP